MDDADADEEQEEEEEDSVGTLTHSLARSGAKVSVLDGRYATTTRHSERTLPGRCQLGRHGPALGVSRVPR